MIKKTSLVILLTVLFAQFNNAQNAFSQPIAVDTNYKIGVLENGLTYFIRANKKPEKRVEMRLMIKAGSVNETENQRGLAHFVEHMCFNGTKNFTKNELVDILEEMGIKFGPELNAFTSFVNTVYMLQIPNDKEGLLDKGFQVLEDWAHQVTFENEEIDKERGVITEEWRLGLGAQDRMFKQWLPVIFKGSILSERLPIGLIDIVKNAPYDTLRKFYKDWYRPDLMGVVVIGDISVDDVETKIKQHFSNIPKAENPTSTPIVNIPNYNQNLAIVTKDKEAMSSDIILVNKKHQLPEIKTIADYRNHYVIPMLANTIFHMRLTELRLNPKSAIIGAYSDYDDLVHTPTNALIVGANVKENRINEALTELLTEINRVRKYGFNISELEREKGRLQMQYESAFKESDKTKSVDYAEEIYAHFTLGDPIPGIENEFEMIKQILPSIQLDELNNIFKTWISDSNMVVVIQSPDKEGINIPTEQSLLNIIDSTRKIELKEYTDNEIKQPLLNKKLKPIAIKSINQDTINNISTIVLKNGVTVELKPTDYKNDEILFSAVSYGGHSLYNNSDYVQLKYLSPYINQSGLGVFNYEQLKKKTASSKVRLSFGLNDYSEEFSGSASPKSIETLFQLLYLMFNEPRTDQTTLDIIIDAERNGIKNVKTNPQSFYIDTLRKIVHQNNIRHNAFSTEQDLQQLNLTRMMQIYKERTANAADFRFVIVGSFQLDSIIPLLQKYLGNLPTSKTFDAWKDVVSTFPSEFKSVTVAKGLEPQSRVAYIINDTATWNPQSTLHLRVVTEILSIRLRESMREEQGKVYGVGVYQDIKQLPRNQYYMNIVFGCNPDNIDSLIINIETEIANLISNDPLDIDVRKVKEILKREIEISEKENSKYLNNIKSRYLFQSPIPTMTEQLDAVEKLNKDEIHQAAIQFLKDKKHVSVILVPENK